MWPGKGHRTETAGGKTWKRQHSTEGRAYDDDDDDDDGDGMG